MIHRRSDVHIQGPRREEKRVPPRFGTELRQGLEVEELANWHTPQSKRRAKSLRDRHRIKRPEKVYPSSVCCSGEAFQRAVKFHGIEDAPDADEDGLQEQARPRCNLVWCRVARVDNVPRAPADPRRLRRSGCSWCRVNPDAQCDIARTAPIKLTTEIVSCRLWPRCPRYGSRISRMLRMRQRTQRRTICSLALPRPRGPFPQMCTRSTSG